MTWRKELCQDDTGHLSSARVIALASGSTLCFSTVLMSVGSFWHPEMLPVVMALGPSLAGMATIGYAANRWAKKDTTNERTE